MNLTETAVKAAKGQDLQDWLQHIAWTDVLEPRLQATRLRLTNELVQATLNPGASGRPSSSAAEIAGKIAGIDFVIHEIKRVLQEGQYASDALRERGISLKD